jgi:hypothetical protein
MVDNLHPFKEVGSSVLTIESLLSDVSSEVKIRAAEPSYSRDHGVYSC